MVVLNNLYLRTGARQGEAKPISEKTATGGGFYNFLSKSMGINETLQSDRKKSLPVSSSGCRVTKSAVTATDSDKTNGAVQNGDPDKLQEVSTSDVPDLKKQPKDALYLIDEIMAALRNLYAFVENIESAGESAAGVAFPEEMESVINQSINRLVELINCTEGSVNELAQDLAEKLNQILTGNFMLIPEGDISAGTGQLKDLISKMLHEAESIKDGLASENVRENIDLENGMETEIPGENGIQPQDRAEISETEQNSHQNQNSDNEIEDNQKDEMTSAGDLVNIPGKQKFNTANLGDDIDRIIQNNAAESAQASEPGYSGPMKSSFATKADILHQVAEKAQILVGSDKSEMIIQLKPESLGKIQLQVIHERGEIVAKFLAENEQVKSILESNMQYLRDALEKNGVDVQSLSVSVGQHNHSDDSDTYKNWHPQNNLQGIYYEELPDVVNAGNTYGYAGLTGDLYEFTGSEINLIA